MGAVSATGIVQWNRTQRAEDAAALAATESGHRLEAFQTKEAAETARKQIESDVILNAPE